MLWSGIKTAGNPSPAHLQQFCKSLTATDVDQILTDDSQNCCLLQAFRLPIFSQKILPLEGTQTCDFDY